MEPTINVGDIVFVKETTDIKEQDIVSFRENNAIVTHRVEDITVDENNVTIYKTKGDANSAEDTGTVKIEDIEGKYCFKIGQVGKVILFLKTKTGIGILAIILILCLFFSKGKTEKRVEPKRMGNKQKGKHSK